MVVDIICIDTITSYLACNVGPIFLIYSSSLNSWCITYFPVFNLIFFSVPYSFCLVCFFGEYKLNPSSIRVHLPRFYFNKARFSFQINFLFCCCISVLYKRVCAVFVLYDVFYLHVVQTCLCCIGVYDVLYVCCINLFVLYACCMIFFIHIV